MEHWMFTRFRGILQHPVSVRQFMRLLRYRVIHPWLSHLLGGALWHSAYSERKKVMSKSCYERLISSRFFFTPRNRKEFFLDLLNRSMSSKVIIGGSDTEINNTFSVFGSAPIKLSLPLPWHEDVKTGGRWELRYYTRVRLHERQKHSDIKVPWEISRFHFAAWLGRVYWISGNEAHASKFAEMVEDWIRANPFPYGVNWMTSMEVAFRAINWAFGCAYFVNSKSFSQGLQDSILLYLYLHGAFIEFNLEFALRNHNHLLSDATGLFVLGLFFQDTKRGRKWLRLGKRLLEEEIRNQVRPDGVDYEQSIAYHRLVTELLVVPYILAERNHIPFSPIYRQRLEKMFEFIMHYTKPDGSVPLIGDADDGRLFRFSPSQPINDHRYLLSIGAVLFNRADFKKAAGSYSEDALWLLGAEGFEQFLKIPDDAPHLSSKAFPHGGFYIMRYKDAYLIIDAGEIGMDGLGGHGHNDTFSFELFFGGETFITDSGTYCYTCDINERQKFRSTYAHNTIVVDERELAEFASIWHIKEDRTEPRVLEWYTSDEYDAFEAEHYGYTRLSQPVIHRRRVEFKKGQVTWVIKDMVDGDGEHTVEFLLHLAPGVQVEQISEGLFLLKGEKASLVLKMPRSVVRIEPWEISPSYGVKIPSKRLRIAERGKLPISFETTFTGIRKESELKDALSRV